MVLFLEIMTAFEGGAYLETVIHWTQVLCGYNILVLSCDICHSLVRLPGEKQLPHIPTATYEKPQPSHIPDMVD